jgi:hypothetical protein
VLFVQLGGTLEQAGVEVENARLGLANIQTHGTDDHLLSGISLTARGTTQQQRHLTVSNGLLGQIVVDDDGVAAVVTEPLTHGTASKGSNVLQRGSLGSSSSDDNGVLEGVVLLQSLDELSDSRTLLTDSNVDTVQLLGLLGSSVDALLVQDGIQSDSSLTGLTVTNDKLTLTTADGHHGVDRFETSLHGLVDGTTRKDTRGLDLGTALLLGVDGSLAINRVAKGINYTTQHFRADWNVDLSLC